MFGLRGGLGDDGPGAFEELGIGRRHGLADPSIAGDEAFREADDPCSLDGGSIDGLLGERDRLLGSGREPEIGECDADDCHTNLLLPGVLGSPVCQSVSCAADAADG